MSGSKETYTRITTTEYNKMMRATREVESIDSKIEKRLNYQKIDLENRFNRDIKQINQKFIG